MSMLLDLAARKIVQAFAGCLLLPVRPGIDPDSAPPPLATEARSAANLSQLAMNSIAVVLGNRSRGLLGIRFDCQADLEVFLDRNPESRNTLITSHGGLPIVWHRAKVAYYAPFHSPGMAVLLMGNVLVYDRAALQCPDEFLNVAEINLTELSALDWGPDSDGKIAAWLAVLTHGELYRRGGRGQPIPNTQAWRAYLVARLRPTTAYDTRERQFYHRVKEADWQPLSDAHLRDELRRLVQVAPVGTAEARARLTDEWLSRVLVRLKSSLAAQLQILEDHLRIYLQQRLSKESGANTTNAELFADYEAHCNKAGQPLLSPMKFKLLIGQILRGESWRVGYSKSIHRPAGQQNGWRGVRLRDQSESLMPTHGADGAPGVKT